MSDVINQRFDFYYGKEAEQFNFYRIPKILFTDKRFSALSVEAKVLYGLMLDRMSLSIKNGWIDDKNRVYIYFKLEDAMEYMRIGKDKGVKLFAELDSEKGCGLIHKKRQGLGKPAMIYVMNFNSAIEIEEVQEQCETFQTSEKPKSELLQDAEVLTSEKSNSGHPEEPKSVVGKNRTLDFYKADTNNTEINNNKYINTDLNDINLILSNQRKSGLLSADVNDEMRDRHKYRETICVNIEFDALQRNYGEEMANSVLEIMVDAVCSKKDYLSINCEEIPQPAVKCRLLKLDYSHVEYVLDCLNRNTTKVRNIRSYLLTALYNSFTIGPYYTAEVNHDMYGSE